MHSARRQKGAKIISSLYDEEDDDEVQAPVRAKDAPKEGITVAGLDLGSTEIITPDNEDDADDNEDDADDKDDEYIPLDPETIAEERELLEAELYNEQDLEEGVGFQDEELALDSRRRDAQEDDRRREMREAIAEYEDELQAAPSVGHAVHDAVARDATWAAAATTSTGSAPRTGTNGHPPPPLPVLAESLSRLRMRLAGLTTQRAEHRAGLEALDSERIHIAARQSELQAGLDQAGLDYQLARVALDARRSGTAPAEDNVTL
ncbi:hypothetical protein D0Z00_000168 [Geotrichum galactomycetum]|uniref:Uncharacterized protein n=1 Tax=Geotrichum galactomycetum TaxID=27317 RepID=A0ACB6VAJ5_9ASCO|nr:hypothetical protein D0Z00_000168 [Geotrichum candidum]